MLKAKYLILSSLVISLNASAESYLGPYLDYADVINVVPVMAPQFNREVCGDEIVGYTTEPAKKSNSIEAFFGSVFGSSSNHRTEQGASKDSDTTGIQSTGNQISDNHSPSGEVTVPIFHRVCHQVPDSPARIDGYKVTYVFGGHEFTSIMAKIPGARVRVAVNAIPQ